MSTRHCNVPKTHPNLCPPRFQHDFPSAVRSYRAGTCPITSRLAAGSRESLPGLHEERPESIPIRWSGTRDYIAAEGRRNSPIPIVLLGTWRGVPLYVSEEQYEDADGTMKYFVPEKEVLVAATGVQGVMAYAGIAQANDDGKGMQVYAGRRVPLIYWDTSGEDYRRLRLSSRPIPIPGNTDSWTVLQVLA